MSIIEICRHEGEDGFCTADIIRHKNAGAAFNIATRCAKRLRRRMAKLCPDQPWRQRIFFRFLSPEEVREL